MKNTFGITLTPEEKITMQMELSGLFENIGRVQICISIANMLASRFPFASDPLEILRDIFPRYDWSYYEFDTEQGQEVVERLTEIIENADFLWPTGLGWFRAWVVAREKNQTEKARLKIFASPEMMAYLELGDVDTNNYDVGFEEEVKACRLLLLEKCNKLDLHVDEIENFE